MRDTAGSAAAPAARLSDYLRRSGHDNRGGPPSGHHKRLRAIISDENSRPPPPPRETIWLREAAQNDIVADGLTYLRGEPDWFDLHKAFERMRDDINNKLGQNKERMMGWPDKKHLDHFTQSAQVYRHSKAKWPSGYNMANAMKILEAREFVQGLTRAWLDWRAT